MCLKIYVVVFYMELIIYFYWEDTKDTHHLLTTSIHLWYGLSANNDRRNYMNGQSVILLLSVTIVVYLEPHYINGIMISDSIYNNAHQGRSALSGKVTPCLVSFSQTLVWEKMPTLYYMG